MAVITTDESGKHDVSICWALVEPVVTNRSWALEIQPLKWSVSLSTYFRGRGHIGKRVNMWSDHLWGTFWQLPIS